MIVIGLLMTIVAALRVSAIECDRQRVRFNALANAVTYSRGAA